MEKTKFVRFFRMLLCLVVIAGTLLAMTACGNKEKVAQGEKSVVITVVDDKGEKTDFTATTNGQYLIDALNEIKLVEGEEGDYGLYIKTVNGITADYDKDGAYWAFTKDGEMLMTGADSTPIADGEHYEITYTK